MWQNSVEISVCLRNRFTNVDDFVLFFAKEVSWKYVD